MKRLLFYIIVLQLLLASCKGRVDNNLREGSPADGNIVELSDYQINTIGIKLGTIQQRQLSGTIHATGRLELSPQNRAEVTSLVSGSARRILVKEGQSVRAGQELALVENTGIVELQKDYLIAARRLSLAQQALARQQNIRSQGAGIEKNLEQAKAEFDMAVAMEKGLHQQLEQLGISSSEVGEGRFSNTAPVRSPISGVVGEILISTGSFIDNGTVLMRVYDNRALHADVNVFETDIASIHIGQRVTVKLSDSAGSLLSGRVSLITAALDDDSKSASVHIDLESADGLTLLPNMFVSAVIHCDEQTCGTVPDEAIVMGANRKYVFVSLGSNRFRKQEVVTGLSEQGYTQITFVDDPSFDGEIVLSKTFYLESMLADHGEE